MTTSMLRYAVLALLGALSVGCAGSKYRVDQLPMEAPPILHIQASDADLAELRRAAEPALTKAPAAQSVIHVEGVLPTSSAYKQDELAKRDWQLISALATYYAVSGDKQYLERYELYLSAWLAVYRISGNPVDETDLSHVLLAFRESGGALAQTTQKQMQLFACQLAERYQQAQPLTKNTTTNNWQSHRVKLAVMGAFICGDPVLIARVQTVFANQIRDNLLPSGEAKDFYERDALHYVVYSLEPLLEASLFAQKYGKGIFYLVGPGGQSLSRSLDWLAPYARGDVQHLEFVNSTVAFDAQRAAAGVVGYSGPFDTHQAQYLFWLAAQLEPSASRWNELSLRLGAPPAVKRLPWGAQ
jgi:hypothetical protein